MPWCSRSQWSPSMMEAGQGAAGRQFPQPEAVEEKHPDGTKVELFSCSRPSALSIYILDGKGLKTFARSHRLPCLLEATQIMHPNDALHGHVVHGGPMPAAFGVRRQCEHANWLSFLSWEHPTGRKMPYPASHPVHPPWGDARCKKLNIRVCGTPFLPFKKCTA